MVVAVVAVCVCGYFGLFVWLVVLGLFFVVVGFGVVVCFVLLFVLCCCLCVCFVVVVVVVVLGGIIAGEGA